MEENRAGYIFGIMLIIAGIICITLSPKSPWPLLFAVLGAVPIFLGLMIIFRCLQSDRIF